MELRWQENPLLRAFRSPRNPIGIGIAKIRVLTLSATLSTRMCRRLYGEVWEGKRKRRTAAEVAAIREAAHEALVAGHPMTLRQVHYRLVGRGDTTYTNTRVDYNQLSKRLVRDRLEGLIP